MPTNLILPMFLNIRCFAKLKQIPKRLYGTEVIEIMPTKELDEILCNK
jgi:hypothetical protein